MPGIDITVDDPRADDVRALLARHLAFAHEHSPPEDVHALDLSGLLDPTVTFFSARRGPDLVGIGALKELDDGHGVKPAPAYSERAAANASVVPVSRLTRR